MLYTNTPNAGSGTFLVGSWITDSDSLNAWDSTLAHCLNVTEEDPLFVRPLRTPGRGHRLLPPVSVGRPAAVRCQPRSTWRRPVEVREALELSVRRATDRERNSWNNIGGKTSVVAALIQLHLRGDCGSVQSFCHGREIRCKEINGKLTFLPKSGRWAKSSPSTTDAAIR